MNESARALDAFRIAARRVEISMVNARKEATDEGPDGNNVDYLNGYADAYEQAWQDMVGVATRAGVSL